ncbi:MAG TPA: hypothetical protein VF691_10010 [Cytophagaceae bacterium]|jgi:hypothetical protein
MEIDNNIDKKEQEEKEQEQREQESQIPNPEASTDGRLDPEDAKFSNDQTTDEVVAKRQ